MSQLHEIIARDVGFSFAWAPGLVNQLLIILSKKGHCSCFLLVGNS